MLPRHRHRLKLIPICAQFLPKLADTGQTQSEMPGRLTRGVASRQSQCHLPLEPLQPAKPIAEIDAAASNVGRICPAILDQLLPVTASGLLEQRLDRESLSPLSVARQHVSNILSVADLPAVADLPN